MAPTRRRLRRKLGERRYKRLFTVSCEGHKTELQYFDILNSLQMDVYIRFLNHRSKNSPLHVLKRMREHLKKEALGKSDEAWIIVDKDNWTDEQLTELYKWSQESKLYGLALSNPKFEYWLLLHFEDGANISTSEECTNRLKQYLPEYDKGIDAHKITKNNICKATQRAKDRDNPPCTDWPRGGGNTTIYRLASNIFK